MPALIERPKMTRTMYQALKRHIVRERERKKQEKEQDEMMERQKKDRELKKKKEEEDSLTLEQTKEQIQQLEKKLESLRAEKHELFSQLKKVLHQEDEVRRRAQIKEQSEMLSLQQAYPPHSMPVSGHTVLQHLGPMSGRPTLYRPTQQITMMPTMAVKRPRSPSPPPTSIYQQYGEAKLLPSSLPVAKQQARSLYSHPTQTGDYKPGNFQQSQSGHVTYPNQAGHSYQQPAAAYTSSKSPGAKYNQPSQSAFTSYPSHFAHQQKQITEPFPGYLQRMQQPGYMGSPHGANLPLQQQLEHANQKAGFNEDKYKLQQQQQQVRGVAPLPGQQPSLMHQQIPIQQQPQPQPKGSIMTGYSARSQAPPPSSTYQSPNSQSNYPSQQQGPPGTPGRSPYNAQTGGRYY